MEDVEHRLEEGGDAAEHLQASVLKIYNALQVCTVYSQKSIFNPYNHEMNSWDSPGLVLDEKSLFCSPSSHQPEIKLCLILSFYS